LELVDKEAGLTAAELSVFEMGVDVSDADGILFFDKTSSLDIGIVGPLLFTRWYILIS
jgi:hypothetical protein